MNHYFQSKPAKTTSAEHYAGAAKGLEPVNQPESLKQIAYYALHRALISGELQPGQIYKEKELASMLGISRTPVREALLGLAAKGLVNFLPRKGIQITQFKLHDLNEIYELRKALELMSIEKVAALISKDDLKCLQDVLDAQRKSAEQKDFMEFLQHDRAFHTLISEMANNRRLVNNLENIRDLIHLMGAHALSAHGRLQEVVTEHQAVLDALSTHNPEEARKKMGFHLEMSRKKAEFMLFPHGDADSQV